MPAFLDRVWGGDRDGGVLPVDQWEAATRPRQLHRDGTVFIVWFVLPVLFYFSPVFSLAFCFLERLVAPKMYTLVCDRVYGAERLILLGFGLD